jgi:hypothetical protein
MNLQAQSIYYGTNFFIKQPGLSVTNVTRTRDILFLWSIWLPGVTYRYYVVSVDEAGNVATNS